MVENYSMMQTYCTHLIQLAAQNSTQMAASHNEQFSNSYSSNYCKKSLLTHLNSLLCYALDDRPENKLPREGKKYATKKMALIPSR